MWSKHKKLKEWVARGLMTEEQSNAIHEYESAKKHGSFGRNLVGLSLFAILMGILSIIASNWNAIPGEIKIAVHVLLNAGIGYAAYRTYRQSKEYWAEGLALTFFGLTLTLIILTGQVFQLSGSYAGALLFWMLSTLPFMLLFSKTRLTAVPWIIAFLGTFYTNVVHHAESLPNVWEAIFYQGGAILLPLAMMADGKSGLMNKFKPVWADIFVKTGAVLLAITASLAIITGYDIHSFRWAESHYVFYVYVVAFVAMAAHAGFYSFYRNDAVMKAGALFAFVSVLFCFLPYALPFTTHDIVKAVFFIVYWIFIGWIAQGLGHMRLVSLSITIIAIRIFAVYIELFGSLMDTGIGLIFGGLVMLALIFAGRKVNRRIVNSKSEMPYAA